MPSHPTDCKIYPNFRGVMWTKAKMCTQTQLNMVFSPSTGFLCENKTPIRVKFCFCQHSSLTVMRMTYPIGHAALYSHIYARKKLSHKAKFPYFVVKEV